MRIIPDILSAGARKLLPAIKYLISIHLLSRSLPLCGLMGKLMVGINRSLFHLGERGLLLYMQHRSMLLGKLLALYLPLSAGAHLDKQQDPRLDQLELQKYMAMQHKWILSKGLKRLRLARDQP